MATVIQGKCICGYDSLAISLGAELGTGMRSFLAPAYCSHCQKLLTKNYLERYSSCSFCGKRVVFYNEEELSTVQPSKENVLFADTAGEKGQFILRDREYLCPDCGCMNLRFVIPAQA